MKKIQSEMDFYCKKNLPKTDKQHFLHEKSYHRHVCKNLQAVRLKRIISNDDILVESYYNLDYQKRLYIRRVKTWNRPYQFSKG